MSKKRYRPKASTTHQPPKTGDAKSQNEAKIDDLLRVADAFNAGKKPVFVSEDEIAREKQLRQAEAAHKVAGKAAAVITEQAQAEQEARKEGDRDGWLKDASDEELQALRKYGDWLMKRLDFFASGVVERQDEHLTDDEVRDYVDNGVRFLNQVVAVTSAVLDTVDAGSLRKIVASDMQSDLMHRALRSMGYDPEELLGPARPEPAKDDGRDHRKRPRGRRHPLLQLVALAASSVRLMKQITRETNPHVYNRKTLEERRGEAEGEMLVTGVQETIDKIGAR